MATPRYDISRAVFGDTETTMYREFSPGVNFPLILRVYGPKQSLRSTSSLCPRGHSPAAAFGRAKGNGAENTYNNDVPRKVHNWNRDSPLGYRLDVDVPSKTDASDILSGCADSRDTERNDAGATFRQAGTDHNYP